ncbi:MAG TPA: Nramp family divalent metal transporter [Pyrinomonadaceae bacterium]|nr:Nramp family divalent metal transporter [Pyrinomonadaceae bacterium]
MTRPASIQGPQGPQGLEPLDALDAKILPTTPRTIRAGLRINIRGRSVQLRGLRRSPTGLWRWLAILGPGLIATSAGNDAGGIATYSQAGAKFGYELIWVMVLLTLSFAVVQEMCARLGAATGRGLLDLIRERYGITWALFAIVVILIANGGVTVSEFVGIGAAMELMGVSKYVAIPLGALLIWYLVIFGTYSNVERILLLMTLVFFAYPVAAYMANPNWAEVARGAFIPKFRTDPAYIFIVVGLLGTTITPYIQIFQQSSLVEKGVARRHYGPERIDAYVGAIFSNLMSISMIIATAATLYVAGQRDISSAADAARALEPVVGSAAKMLFGVGLLGATLLAGAVLPLATAYAVSEAFGAPKGVNLDFRRGKVFFSLFTALIVIGAALALIPNVPVMKLLVGVQVLNGILLPIILVFILLLINDKHLTADLKNTRRNNVLGVGTLILITTAVVVMLGSQLLDMLGVKMGQ